MDKEQKFIIGRGPEFDVVLSDDSISRRHAELIVLKNGDLFLIDCHSMNGTAVLQGNKFEPIRQQFVTVSDTLTFGKFQIQVREILEMIRRKHPQFTGIEDFS